MKKMLLFLIGCLVCTGLMSQVPMGISHQMVIRNAQGELLTNRQIGIKVSILRVIAVKGSYFPVTEVYSETHTLTSNANGLVFFVIGQGGNKVGTLSGIDWTQFPYLVQTEVDPDGGTNYTIAGTADLLSVPYAFYAAKSGSPKPGGIGDGIVQFRSGNEFGGDGEFFWDNTQKRLGIGTNSPSRKLSLHGGTGSVYMNFLNNTTGPNYDDGLMVGITNTDAFIWNYENTPLQFATNNLNRMVITSAGNVGIGTTTPAQRLVVDGNAHFTGPVGIGITNTDASAPLRLSSTSTTRTAIFLENTTSENYAIQTVGSGVAGRVGNFEVWRTGTGGGPVLTIKPTGDVGIGTNAPAAKLHVVGTTKLGSAGVNIVEVREITGTTHATNDYVFVSYPSGYTQTNTRIMAIEINSYTQDRWSGGAPIYYELRASNIYIKYTNDANFKNKPFRMLLMRL